MLAVCAVLLANISAHAASITRGPYLQLGTPTSMVVRWRTDVPTDSSLRFGTNAGVWVRTLTDATLTNEHVVAVSNLQAFTKHFYQIGSTAAWFAADTNNFFITSPLVGIEQPVRIWAIGDAGTASSEQVACRDAYAIYNGSRPTDVWLMLGDNAYNSGTDAEYQLAVYDMYPTFLRNTVSWPTIGNHDAGNSTAVYLPMFTLPENGQAGGVPSGTERYYSFDYANIHFVCLDSSTSSRASTSPMCNWLRSDLGANTQQWVIVYFHHPPYTKGSHDSDAEGNLIEVRENIVPILEDYGADLVLAGHSHCYERSVLLDGHYGFSSTLSPSMKKDAGSGREDGTGAYRKPGGNAPHEGAVYTVAGSSGHSTGGALNHPVMFTSLDIVGSLVIDVNGGRLDVKFLQSDGSVGDYFTMLKAAPATTPPAAPTNLVAIAAATNRINLTWIDRATNEQGFRIERSLNGLGFTEITTVAAGVTNFGDSGLSTATTYYYRVRAYNGVGTSGYSPIAFATTSNAPPQGDITPPAAVTNLSVIGVTSNSATLWWTAPGDDGLLGTATFYDMRYSTSAITSTNFNVATQAVNEPSPASAGTAQSLTITGLVAGRTYYFALKTFDEVNNASALSSVPNVTIPFAAAAASWSNMVLIASNSVWKYLDNGSNQSNAWSKLAYDDTSWKSGPAQLGYGSGTEATVVSYGPSSSSKYITTYFRRRFTVLDPAMVAALNFAVQRDDGVIVWVNGKEVFRDNMPTTGIDYLTPAVTSVSGTNKTAFHLRGPFATTNLLVAGDNVVAAEVHQRSGSSASMDFNLELKALLAAPVARIARNSPTQVMVYWPAQPQKRYRIEYTDTIPATNWTRLGSDFVAPGPIAWTNAPGSGTMRFYRVSLVP